jgi:hypothetical protein
MLMRFKNEVVPGRHHLFLGSRDICSRIDEETMDLLMPSPSLVMLR